MTGRTLSLAVAAIAATLFAHFALAASGVYYEPDIRDIVRKDCARCHSGSLRNLMSWDSVRSYVDNGLLAAMLQGPMRQFAGPVDANAVLAWIEAGAPENPPRRTGATTASTTASTTAAATTAATTGTEGAAAAQPLTYSGAVEPVLARDCLRCHLGPYRKMTTYEEVKALVDSGRFQTMLAPGGLMAPFAGNDAQTLLNWSKSGALK